MLIGKGKLMGDTPYKVNDPVRSRGRSREHGQAAIELALIIPIAVAVLLLLLQTIAAAAGASHIRDAARDGARAVERGASPYQAATDSLPSWVDLESVNFCGRGCIQVSGNVPIGVPGVFEVTHVSFKDRASFRPRVD